jgi:hypothetical protein
MIFDRRVLGSNFDPTIVYPSRGSWLLSLGTSVCLSLCLPACLSIHSKEYSKIPKNYKNIRTCNLLSKLRLKLRVLKHFCIQSCTSNTHEYLKVHRPVLYSSGRYENADNAWNRAMNADVLWRLLRHELVNHVSWPTCHLASYKESLNPFLNW